MSELNLWFRKAEVQKEGEKLNEWPAIHIPTGGQPAHGKSTIGSSEVSWDFLILNKVRGKKSTGTRHSTVIRRYVAADLCGLLC